MPPEGGNLSAGIQGDVGMCGEYLCPHFPITARPLPGALPETPPGTSGAFQEPGLES